MADENFDGAEVQEMHEAEVEQALGDNEGAEQFDGAQQEAAQPRTFHVGDEEIDEQTLQDLVSKGKDYTRKTMELSRQREEADKIHQEAQQLKQVFDLWKNNPHERKLLAEHMAREAGIDLPSQRQATPEEWDLWSEGQRQMWLRNQQLEQQVGAFATTLQEVKGYIAKQSERERIESEARIAQQSLKDSLGMIVSSDDLREAVARTGIQDPEAAWLKLNKSNLAKAYTEKGTKLKVTEKPNTPSSRAKVFDPWDPKLDADDVQRLIQQGYIPQPSK